MNNLRIFEPTLPDSFENMFKRFLSPSRISTDLGLGLGTIEMPVDVVEKNGTYTVKADIPGVKKEDINVRIDGNIVQIDAEIRQQKEVKENGDRFIRSERFYGSVSRTFTLAQDVDDSKAKANYQDGVLTLELPKKAMTSAKRLSIQ